MFDEDVADREYNLRMAEHLETSRRFARVNARVTLQLLEALEEEADRHDRKVDAAAAVASVEPFLAAALAVALQGDGDPEERLSLAEVAGIIGIPRHSLTRHVRQGDSPIPFTRDGRSPRFRRADVAAFIEGERVAASSAEGSIVGLLADAIRKALPASRNGRPLLKAPEAAKVLGMTPKALWGACARGTSPVRPLRIGARLFFFRRSEVEAAAKSPPTSEPKEK